MKLLLDTHILLWSIADSKKLSKKALRYMMAAGNAIYFSAASVWEIGIKHAKHPEIMGMSSEEARQYCIEMGYIELPIRADHGIAVETMPYLHNDPFDRIMLAQAKCEGMRFVSHDQIVEQYGDFVLPV